MTNLALKNTQIGPITAETLFRLVRKLYAVWCEFHTKGRSQMYVGESGRDRVMQVLGGFYFIWSAMIVNQIRKFGSADIACETLFTELCRPGVREGVPARICDLLSLIASRITSLREEADELEQAGRKPGNRARIEPKEREARVARLRNAGKLLEAGFWEIADCGILAEVPNSLRLVRQNELAVQNLILVLTPLWKDLNRLQASVIPGSSAQQVLNQISGVALFRPFHFQIATAGEQLVKSHLWFTRPGQRASRGQFAEFAFSIDEITRAIAYVNELKVNAYCREARELAFVDLFLRGLVLELFGTGMLAQVPA